MSAKMRDLAYRGGAATKAAADPAYYRTIGAMGGRASKGKPKTRRLTFDHGRSLVILAKKPNSARGLMVIVADLDRE